MAEVQRPGRTEASEFRLSRRRLLQQGVLLGLSGSAVAAFLAACGSVETTSLTVSSTYDDADALWAPLLGGTGPAPGYVASLDDEHREALRDRWLTSLPARPDGSIQLTATAYAVKGQA